MALLHGAHNNQPFLVATVQEGGGVGGHLGDVKSGTTSNSFTFDLHASPLA